MLLTIETTARPATDLGYLLHKNPARVHVVEMPHGQARLFYPHSDDSRCQVAILLELDPISLSRRIEGGDAAPLEPYVNDRPYVASSFLSVAIGKFLGTALNGRSKERQELADRALPWTVRLPALACRGGEALLERIFSPLGYELRIASHAPITSPPDPLQAEGRILDVTLTVECRLQELLQHLTVLIPVLDDKKHYWVGEDEVEKLLTRGGAWLASHPERELITRRYLRHQRRLTRDALARLLGEGGEEADPDRASERRDRMEDELERTASLNERRIESVVAVLLQSGARSIADLGCGEGRLVRALLEERQFERILGMDVSISALQRAAARLHLADMPAARRTRLQLVQGSLAYRDERLADFDAAVMIEVIEHLELFRLEAMAKVVFGAARPRVVLVTTPNREYNARWPALAGGKLRHPDHRFEWTRAEFRAWSAATAAAHGYTVRHEGIGDEDPSLGAPTQMGVFER